MTFIKLISTWLQNWQIVLLCGVFLVHSACTYSAKELAHNHQLNYESAAKDTIFDSSEALTKIYSQAIAEFIKASYHKDGSSFDTLFFGNHKYGQPDDFPDIELPKIIEQTQIRLIAPEAGLIKQKAQKDLVYVNMVGWVEKSQAEFIFVVFFNGAAHQYDYFISFDYKTSVNKFELVKIEFENHLQLNGQKPKRHTIFKDGKYGN